MTDQQTPNEPQISQPLVTFATTAPEPPQPPAQPEAQVTKPFAEIAAENLAQQQPQQNAYDSIIAQQQEQIAALMAQNQALNGQITQMVQSGAQFVQQAPQMQPQQHFIEPANAQQTPEFANVYEGKTPLQQFAPPALSDNQDWSLEGLAEGIGKKN